MLVIMEIQDKFVKKKKKIWRYMSPRYLLTDILTLFGHRRFDILKMVPYTLVA